jgi:uncharacterized membrane protein YvbJ
VGEPRPKFCAYCGNTTHGDDLCATCGTGVTKAYYEANEVILNAYARRGLAQIEHLLASYARFQNWLTEHHQA